VNVDRHVARRVGKDNGAAFLAHQRRKGSAIEGISAKYAVAAFCSSFWRCLAAFSSGVAGGLPARASASVPAQPWSRAHPADPMAAVVRRRCRRRPLSRPPSCPDLAWPATTRCRRRRLGRAFFRDQPLPDRRWPILAESSELDKGRPDAGPQILAVRLQRSAQKRGHLDIGPNQIIFSMYRRC